jgi:hypothetical protein
LVHKLEALLQQAAALQEAAAVAVGAPAAAPPSIELSAAAAGRVCRSEGRDLNEKDVDVLNKTNSASYGSAAEGAVAAGMSTRTVKASELEDVWAGEEI